MPKQRSAPYVSVSESSGESLQHRGRFSVREELLAFHKQLGNENCLNIADKLRIRITDEQARDAVKKISGCDNVAEFQKLTPINRDKAILKLRDQHLSLRQISRLTGVSLTIVRRIAEE